MTKQKGEQLSLLFKIHDRPRSEWVDMHCPALADLKPGDRVSLGGGSGRVQIVKDADRRRCTIIRWSNGVEQYLTRSLVRRLQNCPDHHKGNQKDDDGRE